MLETLTSYRPAPVAMRLSQAALDPATQSLTSKTQAGKEALTALKKAEKKQNESARDMAYQRVMRVLERIKALKAMKGGDPVQSAKVITQLSKELRSALKAYMATGGKAGDLASSAASPASTPATSEAAKSETPPAEAKSPINPYAPPGQPLPEDASFLKDVRDLVKALKALLLREVNKAQGDAKADPKVFEEAQKEILRLEKDLDDAQRDLAQMALSSGTHADTAA